MDNLSIDLKKILPFVVDAFTGVYGEGYHDIISKRVNNAIIIPYYDIEGLNDYISYIERCKKREYAIQFLEKIGVNVEEYKKANYTQGLDNKIEKILGYYMNGSYFGFSNETDYWVPLQAFKSDNIEDPKNLLRNKIKIINYLLNNNHEQVTEENFNSFITTEEYQQILKKIDELNLVYEPLLSEYRKWDEKLQPCKDFVESETRRKKEILERKKELFFEDISLKLPIPIINAISNKSLKEKIETILGTLDIGSVSAIELFHSEKIKKLKSKDVDLFDKNLMILTQANYLKNIGINTIDEKEIKCKSEEDVNNYLNFLGQDDIKQYIPSDDLIHFITSTREKRYEEALREYHTTRKDFIDTKANGFNEDSLEFIYEQIKCKTGVFVLGTGATIDDNEFVSIMFYTIRSYDGGNLCRSFMHECGHIIDQNSNGTAFEAYNDFDDNSIKNPYNDSYRKYEKFNETLNDIFTMEAIELLHHQEIYLIEPQEFTLQDISNCNTALITKNILQPLLSKFRVQVIRAKINANRDELTKYIGKNNFEELVDVVNKVDYLSRNGVIGKLDTSPDDEIVQEYFEQVKRAEKIYHNIDDYYDNNAENLITPISVGKSK